MARETHEFSQFVIKKQEPSRFIPGATITMDIGIYCPRCKAELPMLEHGESQACGHCFLTMQVFGNGIEIWGI